MKDIAVTVAAPEVELVGGTGAMTVSVVNRTQTTERVVLTAVPAADSAGVAATGSGAPTTVVERPLRDVPAGQTEQYVASFDGRSAAPGRHPVKFIASPSEEATEEYADRAAALVVVVPPPGVVPPPPPSRRWWLIAAGVALLLVIGGAVFLLTRPKSVTVPDVVGKTQAAATQVLSAAGLSATPKTAVGPKPLGVVVSQSPAAGQTTTAGGSVEITVRVGLKVVDVTKQPLAQAQESLKAAGFTAVSVVTQQSEVAAGTVIAQAPPPGTEAALDDPVTITVASPVLVPLPNLNGTDIRAALSRLAGLGLNGVQQNQCPVIPFGSPRCVVVNEVPAPGTPVPKGSQVNLVVAFG